MRQTVQDLEAAGVSNRAAHQAQLQLLEQQADELRKIITSSMHTKRASTLSLETAMNLSKGDAKRLTEVQVARSPVERGDHMN